MDKLDELYKRQAQELAKLEAKEVRATLDLFAKSKNGLVGELVTYIDDGLTGPAYQAIRTATREVSMQFYERLEYAVTDAAVMGQNHILGLGKAAYGGSVDASLFTATLRGVPEKVVDRVLNRVWTDGLNLKARCWQMEATLRSQLESQLAIGISQGRSVKLLAQDISNSYDQVRDWQALRLVRTETMAAYREGYVEAGKEKDYITGYNWIRSNAGKECTTGECDDLAAGSPYPKDSPPIEDDTHPNCMCRLEAILMDKDDFINSLREDLGKEPLDTKAEEVIGNLKDEAGKGTISPLEAAMDRHGREIATLDSERALAFDAEGNVILEKLGDFESVTFSPEEMNQMRGKVEVLIHSHPYSEPFPPSPRDVNLAYKLQLKEMRVYTGPYCYTAKPLDRAVFDAEIDINFAIHYHEYIDDNINDIVSRLAAGEFGPGNSLAAKIKANEVLQHEAWLYVVEMMKGTLSYQRTML